MSERFKLHDADRFSSQEHPQWHPEMFAQGYQARHDNHGLDQCPSLDHASPFAVQSWRAGWADADMDFLLKRIANALESGRREGGK